MAEPKDSFFRKVVRFVANPATDWHELSSRQSEVRDTELDKSELKAMIERKRRNDFVRKREFDMLRRVRREGLTPDQLAALGGSSRLDDSEVRGAENASPRSGGVKAKIDAIEQQMVGTDSGAATTTRRASGLAPQVSTRSGALEPASRRAPAPSATGRDDLPALPPLAAFDPDDAPLASPAVMAPGLSPLTLPSAPPVGAASGSAAVEVSEVVHDPELDEAVIAFANADFEQCEQALTRLTVDDGQRIDHAETWLVLFDLYRAIGVQERFETLAVKYAHRFGWSAPQWYSLPRLVADTLADDHQHLQASVAEAPAAQVGWVAPEILDIDALARLRSQTLQMPLPWVFDWSALRSIDAEAATQFSVLCRLWGSQALQMRWLGGERLFSVLQEAAPTGVRDADPAYWLARLDALRLANRADQFDETAIDYCVTYEVSPPSWEPARCAVHVDGSATSTRSPSMTVLSEVSTSYFESAQSEDAAVELASVELSGQLVGDINDTLNRLTASLGRAPMVSVSCARLIRVDFLAAGDLLNWVLARRGEGRTVQFREAHRLLALFFGAMGISEHAQVQVRKV